MDLALKLRLAQIINPDMFKDPTKPGYSLTFENIVKTEVLEAKDKSPHVTAHYYVAVHFQRAMQWKGRGKLRRYEEKKISKEQLFLLSPEFIVVTRDDILLKPDEVIRGMKYTFQANVLLLKNYSPLIKAMDLPMEKHMTEKQKALREKKRLEIFTKTKSLFKSNGIWLFFLDELKRK